MHSAASYLALSLARAEAMIWSRYTIVALYLFLAITTIGYHRPMYGNCPMTWWLSVPASITNSFVAITAIKLVMAFLRWLALLKFKQESRHLKKIIVRESTVWFFFRHSHLIISHEVLTLQPVLPFIVAVYVFTLLYHLFNSIPILLLETDHQLPSYSLSSGLVA